MAIQVWNGYGIQAFGYSASTYVVNGTGTPVYRGQNGFGNPYDLKLPNSGARGGKFAILQGTSITVNSNNNIAIQGFLLNTSTRQITRGSTAPTRSIYVGTTSTADGIQGLIETLASGLSLVVDWSTLNSTTIQFYGTPYTVNSSGIASTVVSGGFTTTFTNAVLVGAELIRLTDTRAMLLYTIKNSTTGAGELRGRIFTTNSSGTSVQWDPETTLYTYGSDTPKLLSASARTSTKVLVRTPNQVFGIQQINGTSTVYPGLDTVWANDDLLTTAALANIDSSPAANSSFYAAGEVIGTAGRIVRYESSGAITPVTHTVILGPFAQQVGQDDWEHFNLELNVTGDCEVDVAYSAGAIGHTPSYGADFINTARTTGTRNVQGGTNITAARELYVRVNFTVYTGTASINQRKIDFFTDLL